MQLYDREAAALRAGLAATTVAKLLQDTQLRAAENLGPGRGLGHRFTERDVDALRVYRELRLQLWPRHTAAACAEAFRVGSVPLADLRVVVAGELVLAERVSDPLPAVLREAPGARLSNLGPCFRRERAA